MGAPRIPGSERVATALRLDPQLLDRIDAEARRRMVGRAVLVDFLLRAGLDHLPELPKVVPS